MITEVSRISTNGDRIAKLIDIERENLQNDTKSRVKQMLVQDAEYLLEKKRREEDKRQRLRRMEEEYEKKRSNKLRWMEQKSHKSEQVREKNKNQIAKKMKKNTDYHDHMLKKIAAEHEHDIQRKMSLRKQYLQNSRTTKLFSKTSKDNLTKSKTELIKPNAEEEEVQEKLRSINIKAMKAAVKHEQYQKDLIEKIRQKTKHISEAQKRAYNLSMMTETQKLKSQYHKSEEMQKNYIRAKSMNDKKIIQKRRTFKDKLEKCSQNLRHLSYLEEEKFNELQTKYEKDHHFVKQWKDPRMQKYWQLFQQNSRKIEQKKTQKADEILHKHQQITQQNKIYKQRKNRLIEAIKHS